VDVAGAAVPGIHQRLPVYGCPANPEVVRHGEAMARAFAEAWRPLDAVGLNHLEYPVWPQASLRELFTCFCDACCALADAAGIDLERARVEIGSLYESLPQQAAAAARGRVSAASLLAFLIDRPELVAWLRLRRDAVSAYAERLVSALRGADSGLRVGLEFQLPALAPLVGTDFRRLAPLFDWMTPKFPDYLAGSVVPVIASELAPEEDGRAAALRQRLRDLFELGEEPAGVSAAPDPSEGLLYAGAFRPETIGGQRPHLDDRLAGRPVYPYVWLYGADLAALRMKLAAVKDAGWDGFFLWCWDSDLTSESLRAAHGIL
jgi:hypothetical protein